MTCSHPPECMTVVFGKPNRLDPAAAAAGIKQTRDRYRPMWRIHWRHGNQTRFLGCGFARKKDAQLAMKSLANCGIDWHGSIEDVIDEICKYGTENLRKIMMEALQW